MAFFMYAYRIWYGYGIEGAAPATLFAAILIGHVPGLPAAQHAPGADLHGRLRLDADRPGARGSARSPSPARSTRALIIDGDRFGPESGARPGAAVHAAAAAADHHRGAGGRPGAGDRAADLEGPFAVRRRPRPPAPPAAGDRALAQPGGADHVLLVGADRLRRGGVLGELLQPGDRAGRRLLSAVGLVVLLLPRFTPRVPRWASPWCRRATAAAERPQARPPPRAAAERGDARPPDRPRCSGATAVATARCPSGIPRTARPALPADATAIGERHRRDPRTHSADAESADGVGAPATRTCDRQHTTGKDLIKYFVIAFTKAGTRRKTGEPVFLPVTASVPDARSSPKTYASPRPTPEAAPHAVQRCPDPEACGARRRARQGLSPPSSARSSQARRASSVRWSPLAVVAVFFGLGPAR